MLERKTIVFSSSLDGLCEMNSSFDRGVLRIAYHGLNRNQSFIDKPTFEDAIPSMFNCPIVCNYQYDSDSIGAHDVEVRRRGDNLDLVHITEPVGVIPESAKWWWQFITEDDGSVHEYLCTEALVWRRQMAYGHIKQNGITDHSMEIAIKSGYVNDEGIYVISKFEFTAFCLLEREAPCFESSDFETFSRKQFADRYTAMMEDFKREFAKVDAIVPDGVGTENNSKGGTEQMNLDMLLEKYSLVSEDISFDTDGMTEEELEAKFAEIQAAKNAGQTAEHEDENDHGNENDGDGASAEFSEGNPDGGNDGNEHEGDEPSEKPDEFSLSNNQLESELRTAIWGCRYDHPQYGDMPRYWMIDFDAARGEVYVEDNIDCRLYGMTFMMSGDTPVVDFESRRRKKVEFADWEEGSAEFSFRDVIDGIEKMFTSRIAELEKSVSELSDFKKNRLDQDRREQNNDVFAKFDKLIGNESFDALKKQLDDDCYCLSVDDLEDKCYAILGRSGITNFSLNNEASRLPVETVNAGMSDIPEDEPYNGAFMKYGKNRK